LLRSDQTFRLFSTGTSSAEVDSLNDFRDVLYAASAYDDGLKAASVEAAANLLFNTPQFVTDLSIMTPTLMAYMLYGGGELADTLRYGAAFGPAGAAFKVIGKIGEERILDMVRGAYQAKVLVGSTDEDS
jgi:hypothetical protein